MTEDSILRQLGLIMFTAAIAVVLLRFVRIPTIIAYMAAGLLLGPLTGVLEATEAVDLIAEAGIALLLFLVGLELSLEQIRGVGRVAVVAGVIQIISTTALAAAIAWLLGLGLATAAVIGLVATFSSTVVVVKLLDQKRELNALHGRIAVGILIVQDAAVILALTLFAGLRTTRDADLGSMATGVLAAFAGMAVLSLIATVAARFLLPRLFRWAESSAETLFIWSLAWCFVFILAAHALGLSVELGAFIAGVGLAQLEFAEPVRRRVQPIVNFFVAVFFVTLGLRMQPAAAGSEWPLMLVLFAIVFFVKPAVLLAVVPRLGYGARTSFLTSMTLAQMSEFSFILAALAATAGMLTEAQLSAITLVGFVTIGLSAYVILNSASMYHSVRDGALLRLFGATGHDEERAPEPMRDHVIVVGMNTLGQRIVRELVARGETVLAIDTDRTKLTGLPTETMLGTVDDGTVLEAANFTAARLVVSALQIEDTNSLLAHRCHAAGVPVSVHAFDASLIDELRDIGATHLIVSKHDGTREIALRLRDAGILD